MNNMMTLLHEDYNSFKEINNCIYMFTSPSGKNYIGLTKNFFKRYKAHVCETSKDITQHKKKFYDACVKYGFSNFTITILAKDIDDMELLKFAEVLYIEKYKSDDSEYGYNMTSGGDGVCLIGEQNGMHGRKHTPESIQKMKDNRTPNLNHTHNKGRISVYDIDGKQYKVYPDDERFLSGELKVKLPKPKITKTEEEKRKNRLLGQIKRLETFSKKSEEELAEIDKKKVRKGLDNGRAKVFILESPQGDEFTIYLDNGLKDFCNTNKLNFRAFIKVKNGTVDNPPIQDTNMRDEDYKYNRLNTVGWKITTYRRKDYEILNR